MVQSRVVQHFHDGMNRTRFRIIRAIDQPLQTGMNHRARAHRAWLNCSKQLALAQTMVTDVFTGFAKGYDFGVSGGIGLRNISVPPSAYNPAVTYDHGSYRYLAGFHRTLGRAEGLLHPEFVRQRFRHNPRLRPGFLHVL